MKNEFQKKITELCGEGHRLFFYDETDSTNRRAMEHIRSGDAVGGEVFIARKQSGGKGTRGRSFFSEGGLYMSIILRSGDTERQNTTQLAAVCVCRALNSLYSTDCKIKWVNDIKLCGKKLCGILCEGCIMLGESKPKFTVVGIGINTNVKEFPEEISNIATSLYLYGIKEADNALLAAKIIYELEKAEGDIIAEYRNRCETLGKDISVSDISGSVTHGHAIDISADGALILKTEFGIKRIIHGDVFTS